MSDLNREGGAPSRLSNGWDISDLPPAHLMMGDPAGAKAREMSKWVADRRAEGHTVEVLDPKPGREDSNE